ncbi:MAG: hypothetical protein KIS68_16440 [Bauldia sp.]|nr:hypothetical protein [Bauldia sp.]
MTIRLPLLAALTAGVALAGCVTTPDADAACNPVPAHPFIGEPATPANVEAARVAAGASTARTIAPGQAVTMEYLEGRLNLDVGTDNIILDLRCG